MAHACRNTHSPDTDMTSCRPRRPKEGRRGGGMVVAHAPAAAVRAEGCSCPPAAWGSREGPAVVGAGAPAIAATAAAELLACWPGRGSGTTNRVCSSSRHAARASPEPRDSRAVRVDVRGCDVAGAAPRACVRVRMGAGVGRPRGAPQKASSAAPRVLNGPPLLPLLPPPAALLLPPPPPRVASRCDSPDRPPLPLPPQLFPAAAAPVLVPATLLPHGAAGVGRAGRAGLAFERMSDTAPARSAGGRPRSRAATTRTATAARAVASVQLQPQVHPSWATPRAHRVTLGTCHAAWMVAAGVAVRLAGRAPIAPRLRGLGAPGMVCGAYMTRRFAPRSMAASHRPQQWVLVKGRGAGQLALGPALGPAGTVLHASWAAVRRWLMRGGRAMVERVWGSSR